MHNVLVNSDGARYVVCRRLDEVLYVLLYNSCRQWVQISVGDHVDCVLFLSVAVPTGSVVLAHT